MTTPREAHADEITFELATLLLRGETLELVDGAGRTWEATASTLHRHTGTETHVMLERADAFDVLSALAEGIAATITPPRRNGERACGVVGICDDRGVGDNVSRACGAKGRVS